MLRPRTAHARNKRKEERKADSNHGHSLYAQASYRANHPLLIFGEVIDRSSCFGIHFAGGFGGELKELKNWRHTESKSFFDISWPLGGMNSVARPTVRWLCRTGKDMSDEWYSTNVLTVKGFCIFVFVYYFCSTPRIFQTALFPSLQRLGAT